jgi:predicted dinucleotide-binding enzyme
VKIAMIGVGSVGAALGTRLSNAGYEVAFGLREGRDIPDVLAQCREDATAGPVAEACADAEVIFLAVPGTVPVDALRPAGDLEGKIVVDCCNPVGWDNGPVVAPTLEGSITATLVREYPEASFVKGWNTFGAEFHENPTLAGDQPVDVYLAGADADARDRIAAIATRAGFTPVDAGPLRNAALLEHLAVLWIHLAMVGGQGRDFAFKLLRR